MANTPRMNWPFPNENKHPWYQALENFAESLDASGYAAREDRHIILTGGGTIDWNQPTLEWDSDIKIVSPISGFQVLVGPGTLTIEDGQIVYVTLVRAPTSNVAVVPTVSTQVPSTDTAFALAVRIGIKLYWRNGFMMDDGDSATDIGAGGGGGGGVPVSAIGLGAGNYAYTQAAIPVEEVGGNGAFDGSGVGSLTTYFKAAVTNLWAQTGIGETTRVRLYDMGPAAGPPDVVPRLVSELTFTSQGGPRSSEKALTVVAAAPGTDDILNTSRMYEVVIIQDVSTQGDVAYLGSAGLEVR